MDTLLQLIGKLHPILVHFPLVLVLLGALAECARYFRKAPSFAAAAGWLLGLAAISAILSAGSGWLLASHEHIRSDQRTTLTWHRWLGVATAAASTLAWLISSKRGNTADNRSASFLALVLVAALLVLAAGFFGGELVWGGDWFQPSEVHEHE